MYNRYIPQPDGSYRKRRIPDTVPVVQNPFPKSANAPVPACGKEDVPEAIKPKKEKQCPMPERNCSENPGLSKHDHAGDFLRRILPKDLDTGDLLIIVLLLLMSGDCQEEKNTALLTLALYLFL